MKKSINYAVILIMGFVIAILLVLLFSSQNMVKQQKLVISEQNQKIKEQEAEIEKLSAVTPENILRMTGQLTKEKGLEFLKEKLLSK